MNMGTLLMSVSKILNHNIQNVIWYTNKFNCVIHMRKSETTKYCFPFKEPILPFNVIHQLRKSPFVRINAFYFKIAHRSVNKLVPRI